MPELVFLISCLVVLISTGAFLRHAGHSWLMTGLPAGMCVVIHWALIVFTFIALLGLGVGTLAMWLPAYSGLTLAWCGVSFIAARRIDRHLLKEMRTLSDSSSLPH